MLTIPNTPLEKPWLSFYAKSVPPSVEHTPRVLGELLPLAARRWPKRPAIEFALHAMGRVFIRSTTFAQLELQVERFAASLARRGVVKGDRVALMMPNCPQVVIAFLAVQRLGAIVAPFNPLYTAREVEGQLRDCGAKVIVVADRFAGTLRAVRDVRSLEHIVIAELATFAPRPLNFLGKLAARRARAASRGEGEGAAPEESFDALLSEGKRLLARAALPLLSQSEEETAILLYTGGTTGVSKGVVLSHKNLIVNAEQCRAWAHCRDGKERTLTALPLFHAFALTTCLNLGMLTGATLVLVPDPRDSLGLWRVLDKTRPSVFPVVPTLLVGMLSVPGFEKYDASCVRVCPSAGSALPTALQREVKERAHFWVTEGYGLSEASPVTHGNPIGGVQKEGTIGLPWPDTEARIVDPLTGLDCPFDGDWTEPGELVIRGPQIMQGYWNAPEQTAAQLCGGWLRTGDLAQMDREGYFRIVDRLKDVIVRGGMKIYPNEVEQVLLSHPEVSHAIVIGLPHPKLGEVVKAFVVLKARSAAAARVASEGMEEELLEHCRQNLAKFKVPSEIEFRNSVKLSAVGKPLRRAVREELEPRQELGVA